MSPRKKDDAKAWSYRTGRGTARVVATERVEAGRARGVLLRYTDPRKIGVDKRAKRSLDIALRDERGRLNSAAVDDAKLAADELSASLLKGLSIEPRCDDALTIFHGFTMVADPLTGAHPGQQGAERRRRLIASRNTLSDVELLGPGLTFRSLLREHLRRVWRALATRYRESGNGGFRATEILIADLFAVANWLRADDGKIGPNEAVPPPAWRKGLEDDWVAITGRSVTVKRERHTAEEQDLILDNLRNPEVDPRVSLLIDLGAELRGGQVLRLRRSAVMLEADPAGFAPQGQFVVAGLGKKGGTQVAMTEEQREGLDWALTGYLRDCEAAYQAKAIEDYYLFTPFKIRRGGAAAARNADDSKPMGRQQMLRDFHELERVSGVTPVPGRGWYGLRRLSADLANDHETDTRVLNQAGGWAPGSTVREDTYQDVSRLKIAAKVATMRTKIRKRRNKAGEAGAEAQAAPAEPVVESTE